MEHATRFADYEAAREQLQARTRMTIYRGQQALTSRAAQLAQVHVHGRERRAARGGDDSPVVEADQGHILRDPQAGLTQPVGDAAGDLVVAAEDGVEPGGVAQEQVHATASPFLGPLAVLGLTAGQTQPGGRQSLLGAGRAQYGRPVTWPMVVLPVLSRCRTARAPPSSSSGTRERSAGSLEYAIA